MNVQIIEKEGEPEYAVLPYKQYLALLESLEDKQDITDVAAYRTSGEATFSDDVIAQLLEGVNPILVFRRDKGMTQDVLAKAIGKSKVYIAKLEAGERKGSLNVLADIANVLGVDIDMLVG